MATVPSDVSTKGPGWSGHAEVGGGVPRGRPGGRRDHPLVQVVIVVVVVVIVVVTLCGRHRERVKTFKLENTSRESEGLREGFV